MAEQRFGRLCLETASRHWSWGDANFQLGRLADWATGDRVTWSGVTARTAKAASLLGHSWLTRVSVPSLVRGANTWCCSLGPSEPTQRQEMVLPSSRSGPWNWTSSSPSSSGSRKCCISVPLQPTSGMALRSREGTETHEASPTRVPRPRPAQTTTDTPLFFLLSYPLYFLSFLLSLGSGASGPNSFCPP